MNFPGITARAKLLAAAIGAGVIIAMGALTVAFGGTQARALPFFPLAGAGDTSTQTTAPTTLATPAATPPVKATPYIG